MAILTLGGSVVSSTNPLPVTPNGTQTVAGTVTLGAGSASVGAVTLNAGTASVGTVSVGNFPATQSISATSLPLPSGAATAANQVSEITALQSIATNTGASVVDFLQSGGIAAANAVVSVGTQGVYSISVSVTGTWAATLVAEGQLADNTWQILPLTVIGSSIPYPQVFSFTANGTYLIIGGGYTNVRIRASAYTSGTVAVALDGSLSQQSTFAVQSGAWAMRAQDGVGNALASSTATPVGTEQALLMRPVVGDIVGTATLSAVNATATIATAGARTFGMSVSAVTTLVATLVAEVSFDGGTTWYPTVFDDPATSVKSSSITTASGSPFGKTIVPVGGAGWVRVRATAYTSGSCVLTLRASQVADPSVLFTSQANTAPPLDSAYVSGSDGTLLRPLRTDSVGQLQVRSGQVATYYATSAQFTPVAGDIWQLTGSATKTVKLLRLVLSGVASTASGTQAIALIKRSSANTGGTTASVVAVPADSNFAAATAVATTYTAAPTSGTTVGTVYQPRVVVPATGTSTVPGTILDLDLSMIADRQPLVLRTAAQALALNFASGLLSGSATFQITAIWTEE